MMVHPWNKYYTITERPHYQTKLNHMITLRGEKADTKLYIQPEPNLVRSYEQSNVKSRISGSLFSNKITGYFILHIFHVFKNLYETSIYYVITRRKHQQCLKKLILKSKHFLGPISCSLAPPYHLHFLGLHFLC